MSFDVATPNEMRTTRAAQLRRRLGSACSEMLVSLALMVAIGTVATMTATTAASAAVQNLVMMDDGISLTSIFAVAAIGFLLMLLAPFAFNGLTPGHCRRPRERATTSRNR